MMFHRHKMRINRLGKLSISVFLYTMAITLISPVYPIYMAEIFGSDAIAGFIYGITNAIGLIFCLVSGEIMQKYGRGPIIRIASFVMAVSFFALCFAEKAIYLFTVECIRVIAVTSVILALGVLVRAYSNKKDIESSEGKFYTFSNFAWFIGPTIAGFIYLAVGIRAIFFIGAILTIIGYLSLEKKYFREKRTENVNFHYIRAYVINKTLSPKMYYYGLKDIFYETKFFVKNKNMVIVYVSSFALYMFFSTVTIYFPLILNSFDANKALIGILTGAIVLPLILFEIPFTKMSSKITTNKIVFGGFMMVGVAMCAIYFFFSTYSVFALLIIATVGVAMIEPFKDAYILENTPKRKTNIFFGIFKTSQYLGYFIAPIINSIVIIDMGLKGIFAILGPMFFVFAFLARKLE